MTRKSNNRNEQSKLPAGNKEGLGHSMINIATILGVIATIIGAWFSYAQSQATVVIQGVYFTPTTALASSGISTLTPVETITALPNETTMPTSIFTPTEINNLIPHVDVNKPSEADLSEVASIFVGYKDTSIPSVLTYSVRVHKNATYIWSYRWCAKYSNILSENLSQIKFSFYIDDMQISDSNFLVSKESNSIGWQCQKWSTILSGWDPEQPPTLSLIFEILEPLSDGDIDYSKGAYRHDISINYID